MDCSPCGSGANYSSASTINGCVTLCGAGISTNVTNPLVNVNISSLSVSTLGTVAVIGNIYDSFSRLITATPTTLFTSHPAFTPEYDIVGYTSTGSASIIVDTSNTIVLMSTIGTGGRAIRQSLEYQLYQPGKAHQAFMTWVPQFSGTFDNSIAVRCGIYDDYRDKNTPVGPMGAGAASAAYVSSIYGGLGVETNQYSMGHFFELSGNSWFVVERANSDNNINNVIRVAQSNWNVDTLNSTYGRNPSGVQLSATTEGLFFIERQWLGIGIVQMGIYNNGNQIICHIFQNRGIKKPYSHLNKLPIRYEIEKLSSGTPLAATTAAICMASQIDGEYTPVGSTFSLPGNLVKPTTRVDQTLLPILLLRLQQKYCRATFKVKSIELYGAAAGIYSIFKNPTITGTINWVNHPDSRSMVQYAVFANGTSEPANVISGGLCIDSGFFEKRAGVGPIASVADLIAAPAFCSDIKGNPDVFCIAMCGFSDNNDVNAVARWIEIT